MTRCLHASAPRRRHPPQNNPVVELRQYLLYPEHAVDFLQATNEAADLRKSLVPLRFFCQTETGGRLNTVTHAYFYNSAQDRDTIRAAQGQDPDWKEYVNKCKPFVAEQYSSLFVEAKLDGEPGLSKERDTSLSTKEQHHAGIIELRHYKLKLGYDTVPRFLEFYREGLPSKLEAPGTDPTTSLQTVLFSDVGRLNEVMEVWHHGAGTRAMETSRQAARQATPWRNAIAKIADLALEFNTNIHKPTAFSPLR